MGHLEALLIHLPIQVMNGAICKTKRAKISSQYMKECKPRMSKSRVQFVRSTLILILLK